MFLKRFTFINWGNIPNLEFELGPVNLFSGGNGSGKTTAADAIQTVMTAAHENLFQFNPGQDETTQRGRGGKRVRTLASYVLGCDDGSYARLDPSDGYLAAVFHPTKGESAAPFTAIIGVRAWLDHSARYVTARQDEALFFILPGEELAREQLVADGHLVPLDRLQKHLIAALGKGAVEKYDTKKAYLRRLYGALRGRADAVGEPEAVAAARAFSRFMAYKPVSSINRFVADEILERKDLGEAIRSISSQLKTIHAMERDAARLSESAAILDQARGHSRAYIDRWIELNLLDYTLAQYDYQARQHDYLEAKRHQEEQRRALQQAEGEIAELQARSRQAADQRVSLEAQRLGVDALRQKDTLERERGERDTQLGRQAVTLLEDDRRRQANLDAAEHILERLPEADLAADLPQLPLLQAAALGKKVTGAATVLDVAALVQRDLTGDLAGLEQRLDEARELQQHHARWAGFWRERDGDGESPRDQVARLLHQRESRVQQLTALRRQKQHEIERLAGRQVTYPPYVERALAVIRQHCPQADPRVLCDHVEVSDPRWQAAIEGYLGGARFAILVDPAREAEAIRLVRALPGRDNRARVIQGEKARRDAERSDLPADSIARLLEFSHATARDYFAASYGSVVQVESAEDLRNTRRGLTPDGLASGNYSMWRCDLPDAELVFGAAARERALTAKAAELERLELERHEAGQRLAATRDLLQAIDTLAPIGYADTLAAILATHRELQKLENLLAQLDLGEHAELDRRLERLKEEAQALQEREAALNKRIGELQNELKASDIRSTNLSKAQEENRSVVERGEANLRELAAVWTDLDADARLDHADSEARELSRDTTVAQRAETERLLHQSERHMAEAIAAHNQRCRPGDAIVYTGFDGAYDAALFRTVCAVQRDIDRVYNILKNNILVEKHGQLRELKEAFNNAFVTHLCHAIYQAINDGKRQVEQLNRELQHHRFGSDRETFRFASDWIPEYRDYARFFEEVVKNPTLGDQSTLFDARLSAKSQKVLDELMTMLLDEDEQRALRELERVADYRNYRRYEIYKEVEGKPPIPLSEYGTGSGGQLETPAYIIRAAAITSAFRFTEGDTHLRMVLVDEAFSKMDETRSREVIQYLTESLGLQLVFIMPTSKCGPFMDLISNEFVFAKVPSDRPRGQLTTRVLVDRKVCNQERIAELWANHRKMVYRQAELDFMAEVLGEEVA